MSLPISTVIPTHNRAALVTRAVASALAASRDGDEILVVDDGSTDDTAAALAPFRGRIRHLPVAHGGAGAARNRGIREARHPLVAFLDSDDEWSPEKLDLQRALMQARPDVAFSFSDFSVEDREGRVRPRYLRQWHEDARSWDEILGAGMPFSSFAALPPGHTDFRVHIGRLQLAEMLRDYVPTFTLVARRDALRDAAWFAEDVSCYEDWECFGRLAGAGLAAFLDCETAIQHGHRGPRLTGASELVKVAARIRILERVWGEDAAFVAQHGAAYATRLDALRSQRSRLLLQSGDVAEALAELGRVRAPSLSERILGICPAPLLRRAVAGYQLLRRRA